MQPITSREHPFVKQLVKLQKSSRFRKKMNATLLDGIHLIQCYLAASNKPKCLVISESGRNKKEIESLLNTCTYHEETEIFFVSDDVFHKISPVQSPTGILALISIPDCDHPIIFSDRAPKFCILLEAIQDPGNLGTILRTAAAADVSDIYLSKECADAWSPKTLRASMGAHFFLKIHSNCNLFEIVKNFPGQVLATSPMASSNIYRFDLSKPTAFMFGNEGTGLSSELLQVADAIVSIPMPGKMESLNAAAAVTLCLFEKVRQNSLLN